MVPLFLVTGALWFRLFYWMDALAYSYNFDFVVYWTLGFMIIGGVVYGFLYDNLSNFSINAIY